MTPIWTDTSRLDLALLLLAAQLIVSYGWPGTALAPAPRGAGRLRSCMPIITTAVWCPLSARDWSNSSLYS